MKKILFTLLLLCGMWCFGQEKNIIKCCHPPVKPLVIINDEVATLQDLHDMDIKSILLISVLKGEEATKTYGEEAKGGAIVVKTPVTKYIIDDKEYSSEEFKKIPPEDFDGFEPLKNQVDANNKRIFGVVKFTLKDKNKILKR